MNRKVKLTAAGFGLAILCTSAAAVAEDMEAVLDSSDGSSAFVVADSNTNAVFMVKSSGRTGVGRTPTSMLDVFGAGTGAGGGSTNTSDVVARFRNSLPDMNSAVSVDAASGRDAIVYLSENGQAAWDIRHDAVPSHNLEVRLRRGGVSTKHMIIATNGLVSVRMIEILGGSDLSEHFGVRGEGASLVPGTVVCIDPENPGELAVSVRAYDRRVAGVISGAGGVNTGMIMRQRGSVADGSSPVALSGRVYCWADASEGPIEAGDLLTTSDVPGHAMRVADHERAQGAVLGKAMSPLAAGRGLVLVLVTLQ